MTHPLSQKQLAERLDFVGLDNQQRETLSAISPVISAALDGGLDAFYSKARTHPETARFFANEAHLQHAKSRQAEHWKSIASAKFDARYVDAVSAIGRTHARLGLEPRWYIGGYALLVESILRAVIDHALGGVLHRRKSKPLGDQVASVVKAALVDMDYAISVYLDVLDRQRSEAETQQQILRDQQDVALSALDRVLKSLATGDLTASLREDLTAEFGPLKDNYNASVGALGQTLSDINGSAGEVAMQAREISSAADNMARRTETQASALEQAAAALEEITTNAREAENRTNEVQRIIQASATEASRSESIVDEAIGAMGAIEDSSKRMSQIIGVIDEIAFQTNLLALNAGVEAARAGEQGKGFAVVAQEVRELAQRSASAAREIKGLIGKSSAEVNRGVVLVNDTGKALRSIGGQVQAIHHHMASIASSAREQAAGIAEINATVGNMDLITQQNAAMVEQTSAATHKLSSESATLLSLVRAFKISSHRAVAPGGVQRMSFSRVPAIDAKLDERPIGVSNSARQGMR
ncbi:globin-coupled sensor protein [Shinella granuli]|uniref:Methyl-accepting chemotaxis protein n=1 Tax=Shinella granuli TaxID=323621 RepID=A0A4R2C2Y9_SHIGR|nr:globin-coupled sensor protein [Shinella granuli]TCN34748.1 methyl-accepting chemotaxis protein [Shinella granuli]